MVAEGLTGDARCDPVWVIAELINDLSRRGIGPGLRAGEIVSTGAIIPPRPAKAEVPGSKMS